MTTDLSLRWGLSVSHFSPRLAPWAAFLRRFAAKDVESRFTALPNSSSHAHTESAPTYVQFFSSRVGSLFSQLEYLT